MGEIRLLAKLFDLAAWSESRSEFQPGFVEQFIDPDAVNRSGILLP